MPSRLPGTAADRPTRHVSQQRTDRPENEQQTRAPHPADCCRLVGLPADHEKAGLIRHLVTKYGREQVTQWVQEGVPVEAMGKPREMAAAEPVTDRPPAETGNTSQSAVADWSLPSGTDPPVQSHSHAKPNRQPPKQSKLVDQIRQLTRDVTQKLQTHPSGRSRHQSATLSDLRTNTPEAYERRKKRLEGIDPVTGERSRPRAPKQRGPTCFWFAGIDASLRAAGLDPTITRKMSEEKYLPKPSELKNLFDEYGDLKQYANHGQSGGQRYLRERLQSSRMPLFPRLRPDILTVGAGLGRLFDTKQAEAMRGDSRSVAGELTQHEIEQRVRQREPYTENPRARAQELVDEHATIKRTQQQVANLDAEIDRRNGDIDKEIEPVNNMLRSMCGIEDQGLIDYINALQQSRNWLNTHSDLAQNRRALQEGISASQRNIGAYMDDIESVKEQVTDSLTRQDADIRAGTAWLNLSTKSWLRSLSDGWRVALPSTTSDLEKWFTRTVSAFGGTAVMSSTRYLDEDGTINEHKIPHVTFIVGLIERNGETHVGVRDSNDEPGDVVEIPLRKFIKAHNPFTSLPKENKSTFPFQWLALTRVDLDDETIAELTQSQPAHPNQQGQPST